MFELHEIKKGIKREEEEKRVRGREDMKVVCVG